MGGEVNLKNRVYDLTRRRIARSLPAGGAATTQSALEPDPTSGGISAALKNAVLDEAERIARQCGMTFRLFNYPATEESTTQHRIATNVLIRSRYRYKAGKFLRKFIEAYLKHSPKPDVQTCDKLSRKVTLVKDDPDMITEEEAEIMGREMMKIQNAIMDEDVSDDALKAEEKDAEFVEAKDEEVDAAGKEGDSTSSDDTDSGTDTVEIAHKDGDEDKKDGVGELGDDEKVAAEAEAELEAEIDAEAAAVEVDDVKKETGIEAGIAKVAEDVEEKVKEKEEEVVVESSTSSSAAAASSPQSMFSSSSSSSSWPLVLSGVFGLCFVQVACLVCYTILKRMKDRRARKRGYAPSAPSPRR